MKSLRPVSLCLIIILSNESITKANTALTCDQVLDACDIALHDQVTLNHEQQGLIRAQDDLILTQNKKIKELTHDTNSIFKNPYLYFVVGLVSGLYLGKK